VQGAVTAATLRHRLGVPSSLSEPCGRDDIDVDDADAALVRVRGKLRPNVHMRSLAGIATAERALPRGASPPSSLCG